MKTIKFWIGVVRGFIMIRSCPPRWRPAILTMMAASADFEGYSGPAALLELAAKQNLSEDVGEIIAIVKCHCGGQMGSARVTHEEKSFCE